jgi:hypothetical protein
LKRTYIWNVGIGKQKAGKKSGTKLNDNSNDDIATDNAGGDATASTQ